MIRFLAWRRHRRGLLGFGVGGFLISFFYGLAFTSAAGTTPESRAAFGHAATIAAKQFSFLIPLPTHPETLGGYEQYKWLSGAIIMMMIWAALVGVGVARGDDDSGLTDEWLAAGVSRVRLLLARSAAFGLVLALACLGSVLGIVAVAPLVNQDANFLGEIGKGVSMTAGILAGYSLALLIAQLPAERQTGTALGVGTLVFLLVVNGIADTVPSLSGIGVISPFHWMEQTTSGAPGGSFDVAGTLGLVAVAVVLLGASLLVFQRRDVGQGLLSWGRRHGRAVRTASTNLMLRLPFTEGLWEQRVGLSVWVVGTFMLGAVMVGITKSMVDALYSDQSLRDLFSRVFQGPAYPAFLGFIWFSFALLLLAAYAVVQVSRWAAQDQEGRVEMLLSAPVSRTRVVADRALEFAVASLLIVIGGYLGVVVKAPSSGLDIGAGQLFTASAMMWPFALAFGGLGVAVASRWPRVAVSFLAAFAVVEYFLGDLAPLFKLPDWVANLSVFHLFGNPLLGNASVAPALWMTAVFVLGFGAALLLMQQRDVAGA